MLRRIPERILLNSLDADSVVGITGGVSIAGYGDILAADVIECTIQCEDDCIPKQVTVEVVIPESCECPYSWCLEIKCLPDGSYEVQNTFPSSRLYCYEDPAGGVPTAAATAAQVAADINADPNACVTASVVDDLITLTAKDCLHNFNAYTTSGTVTVTVAFVPELLNDTKLAQMFPIQPGAFGSRPRLTYCGPYCIFHLRMRSTNDTQDISAANHYNGYEREVYFVVKSDLVNYYDDWVQEMLAGLPCLQDFSY